MKSFNLPEALAGKPVVTRDGRTVTGLVHYPNAIQNTWRIIGIASDGKVIPVGEQGEYFSSSNPNNNDFFMKSEKRTGWVNIYPEASEWRGHRGPKDARFAFVYSTREKADKAAQPERAACVQIEWEEE